MSNQTEQTGKEIVAKIAAHVTALGAETKRDISKGEWDGMMTDALYVACGADDAKAMGEARAMAEAFAKAGQITVINDGQVKYPVETEEMNDWEKENGEITSANYQEFCDAVEIVAQPGLVGSSEMIEFCDCLVEAGAEIRW